MAFFSWLNFVIVIQCIYLLVENCDLGTLPLFSTNLRNRQSRCRKPRTAKITSVKERIAIWHYDHISRSSIKIRLVWSRTYLSKVSVGSNRFKELTVASHMPRSACSHMCCPRSNLGITLQGWKRYLLSRTTYGCYPAQPKEPYRGNLPALAGRGGQK